MFSKFYINKYKDKSIKFCQFIGPSVFIWKENKAKYINKHFHHIFSIFEVERKFYNKEKYSYIGHPLLNNIVKISKINIAKIMIVEIAPVLPSSKVVTNALGISATIPAKIIREIPLPIPL